MHAAGRCLFRCQLPDEPPPPELPPPPENPPEENPEEPGDDPGDTEKPQMVAVPLDFNSCAALEYQGWRLNMILATG